MTEILDIWVGPDLLCARLSVKGNGFLESSNLNDKIPILGWEMINPGGVLDVGGEVEAAFDKAVEKHRNKREVWWANDTREKLGELQTLGEEVARSREDLRGAIEKYNMIFAELLSSAEEFGVRELTTYFSEGAEYYSSEWPAVKIMGLVDIRKIRR